MDYTACRQARKPERVRLLFIGESPPAGGTFFYCANSNLYRETKRAFEDAFGQSWSDEAFLRCFVALGCYLIDLNDEPVNHLPKAERRQRAWRRVDALSDDLRELWPPRIVCTPKLIQRQVRRAISDARLGNIPVDFLPFPTHGWQANYRTRLTEILRVHFGDAPCA